MQNNVLVLSDKGVSLSDMVYNTLKDAVMSGKLKPGERLREIALSESLGVSRTPVREAINRLVSDELAVFKKGCGAKVASITAQDAQKATNAIDVRLTLELMSIKLAVGAGPGDGLLRLKEINESLREAVRQNDVQQIAECDKLFHLELCRMGGNIVLCDVMEQFMTQTQRYLVEAIRNDKSAATIAREHEELISAVAERNEESAVRIITGYLDNQKIFFANLLKSE